MKIVHTADWHLGKKLHKQDLAEDHRNFIEWLVRLIKERQIDVLLISGDVFDLANPSSEARALYYDALVELKRAGCQVIITGGNHDSPAVLNAPKELLRALGIEVFGSLTSPSDLLLPLPDAKSPELVVAAVPFLRDSDLRHMQAGESYADRMEAVRQGISRTYGEVAQAATDLYPGIPVLAMGHLFAAGVSTSESERDIQIGNQAAVDASAFGEAFDYMALGHIHKPQQVRATRPVYYSGSPIPLSFSERRDEKRVLLIDTDKGYEPESLPVPAFRELKKVSGTLNDVKEALNHLEKKGRFTTLVEVEVTEPEYDPEKVYALDRWVFEYKRDGVEIVKHRIGFEKQMSGSGELYAESEQLEDLEPKDVFEKRLMNEEMEEETKDLLREAFGEVLERAMAEL